jgi:hypothetical protein
MQVPISGSSGERGLWCTVPRSHPAKCRRERINPRSREVAVTPTLAHQCRSGRRLRRRALQKGSSVRSRQLKLRLRDQNITLGRGKTLGW